MHTTTKRSIAVAAAAVLLLGGGGAAYAYWTSGGTGSGTAATGVSVDITVVQANDITNLRPGGAAQTLHGTFTNPDTAPVAITAVTPAITSVVKAPGAPAGACTADDYVLGGTITFTGPIAVNDTTTWTGATIQFDNDPAANQDGCQGATVTVTYTVS